MSQKTIRTSDDLKNERFERSILVEREAVNLEARTVELAFATENPVERSFGYEILDCRPKSVRLQRLRSGGPVLVGHNPDDQIGVVERVSVDPDRVCRATVRFSRSARGQEILQDIADGIRRNVSVGYLIHNSKLESEKDGIRTFRVTDHEPFEVSIVPMPADIKAGVARDLDTSPLPKETKTMNKCIHCGLDLASGTDCQCSGARAAALADTPDSADILLIERRAVEREQKRIADITAAGARFARHGGPELAARLILDTNASVETFNAAMLQRMNERTRITDITRPAAPVGQITTSLRYNRESLKPFERFGGRAEEMAYRAGQWARAVIFNDRDAQRWCQDHDIQSRVMTEMGGSSGGFTVPDEMEAAITDLRVEYGAARRLCRIIPMGSAVTTIPIRTAGVTAYFTNEQGSPTASDMTWGQAELVAKNLMAETRITTQLAEDAVIDIAAIVADEHALAFAAKEDACMLLGDGTSTYGGIRGINTMFEALPTTMKGAFVCATATADTFAEVAAGDLSSVMAKLPSYARAGAVWLGSPASDEAIFSRLMAAGGGNTITTLQGGTGLTYLGRRREVNEYMPSDPSADLSNKVILLYGDFKRACLLGDRRGITIQVLRELYAVSGQIAILGTERFDFNCQYAVGDTTAAGSVCALIGGAS